MLKSFRIVAYLEGISLLVLMGIAMPLKYVYGDPTAVKVVGWIHGMLFVAYVGILGPVATEREWPIRRSLLALLAASLPFGTFVFDRALARETAAKE